eukprot:RCo009052
MALRRFSVMNVGVLEYGRCLELQKLLLERRMLEQVNDTLVLVQHHPPVYTVGKRRAVGESEILWSSSELQSHGVVVHRIDRGGEVTWHGLGQITGYPIFHAKALHSALCTEPSTGFVPWWVGTLEKALLRTLAHHGVMDAGISSSFPGVWVGKRQDRKIAAIGLQIKRGFSMHGFALNVCPDLSFYRGIIACGLATKGVTSMAAELGKPALTVDEVLPTLVRSFELELSACSEQTSSASWNVP